MVLYNIVSDRFPQLVRSDGKTQMLVPTPHCRYCYKPIPESYAKWGKCRDCNNEPTIRIALPGRLVAGTLYIPRVRGFEYNREILDLKERGWFSDVYAEVLIEVLRREAIDLSNGIFVPVPQTKIREGSTGPLALAESLSRFTAIPVRRCLVFNRDVDRQKTLHKLDREKNMQGSMTVQSREGIDKVFLIDDIMTGGSTIREGTRALIEAGAREVIGIVAARDVDVRQLEFAGVLRRAED